MSNKDKNNPGWGDDWGDDPWDAPSNKATAAEQDPALAKTQALAPVQGPASAAAPPVMPANEPRTIVTAPVAGPPMASVPVYGAPPMAAPRDDPWDEPEEDDAWGAPPAQRPSAPGPTGPPPGPPASFGGTPMAYTPPTGPPPQPTPQAAPPGGMVTVYGAAPVSLTTTQADPGALTFSAEEIEKGKMLATLCWVANAFGVPLFVVPLFIMRDNRFSLYHAKHAAAGWIAFMIAATVIGGIGAVTCIGFALFIVVPFVGSFPAIWAWQGKAKPYPVFGSVMEDFLKGFQVETKT